MTTSGSTTWQLTRDDIIKAALRKLTVLAKGQTPDTEDYSNAVLALNALSAEFQTLGMQLWKTINYSFSPTASTAKYQIGVSKTLNTPFPLKMQQAYIQDTSSSSRIPMVITSHYNYFLFPQNGTSGVPTQLMYQPFNGYGEINLWPTPDSTAASTKTITIIYSAPIEDFVASTDTPDYPKEWSNALIFGLARDLAPEWGLPLPDRQMLMQEAKAHLDTAVSFGTEEASFFIQPQKHY